MHVFVYTHHAQAYICVDVHGFDLDCVHAMHSHCTSSTIMHHFIQIQPVTSNTCLFSLPFVLNGLSFLLLGLVRSAFSGGHTIARDRTDMMDVAWGLCTRSASAVASSTHQPQGDGGNTVGREGRRAEIQTRPAIFLVPLINICVADL